MWRIGWRGHQADRLRAGMAFGHLAAVVLLSVLTAALPLAVQARGSLLDEPVAASGPQISTISARQLPAQGQRMMTLIRQGGPFAYDKDGVVFGNRERILPAKARGYYREYTVVAPTQRSRGARRIVCGGVRPVAPDACFYSADHYASFLRIVE